MPTSSNGRLSLRAWSALGIVIVVVVGGFEIVPWAAATTSSGSRAIYEPVTPARILDTRSPSNPIWPAESRSLQVTGVAGVPDDATAVVLNVAVVSPTATSFLTAYPSDAPRPLAANVNYVAGQPPVSNLVTVKLGPTGQAKLYNNAGQVHLVVDLQGYFRGHDHDDRYYTKSDAQGRLVANSLSCPDSQFLSRVAPDGTPSCGVGATGPQGPAGPPGSRVFALSRSDGIEYRLPSGAYTPMPGTSLQISLDNPASVVVSFAARGTVAPPAGSTIPIVFVRCEVDGVPCPPGATEFLLPTFCCDTRSFSWTTPVLGAGTHTIAMSWGMGNPTAAVVASRTLVVQAASP